MTVDFVGPAFWDTYVTAPCWPAEDARARVEQQASGPGGPAVVAGAVYQTLGGQGRVLPMTGSDSEGAWIHQSMDEARVRWDALVLEGPTCRAYVVSTPSGGRTILSDRRLAERAVPEEVIRRLGQVSGTAVHVDCVNATLAAEVARWYRKQGARVSVDLFGAPSVDTDALITLSDVVVAEGRFAEPWSSPEEFLGVVLASGAEIAAVTLGKEGAWVAGKDQSPTWVAPPTVEKVVDTSGAGDVFHGAFLYAVWTLGMDLAEAARWASDRVVPSLAGFGSWHALPHLATNTAKSPHGC